MGTDFDHWVEIAVAAGKYQMASENLALHVMSGAKSLWGSGISQDTIKT